MTTTHIEALIAEERKKAERKIAKLREQAEREERVIHDHMLGLLHERHRGLHDALEQEAREHREQQRAERAERAREARARRARQGDGGDATGVEHTGEVQP